ncbi:MAG: NADH-quinone oxidoreductase subunit I [Candidatus Eisenbacteria bacterium]|nr:NADH-quinone oxidoreductase subunit I [Candidatus Eisenbacteria bacterium]
MRLFMRKLNQVRNLLLGLKLTLSYMLSKPVTMKYPYETRELPKGYRGLHLLPVHPETGEYKCIGCMICVRTCPDHIITCEMESSPDDPKKRILKTFNIDLSKCTFCGLCVEVCPHSAIEMVGKFDLAAPSRKNLIFTKEDFHPMSKWHKKTETGKRGVK